MENDLEYSRWKSNFNIFMKEIRSIKYNLKLFSYFVKTTFNIKLVFSTNLETNIYGYDTDREMLVDH